MNNKLRGSLVLLLMIPALAIIPACAKKATTTEKETPKIDQAELDRQKELEAERKKQEAEQRRFRAAKTQFVNEDIYFQKGSYRLQPQARTILYRKADFLKRYLDVAVIIEGHTDERGTRETNIAFGDRRAGAVKSFLIREGIKRERLIPVSFGKERPVYTGKTEAGRAKNRRVHFVIKK
jgi:peptidoglycan-associated lipoprotein